MREDITRSFHFGFESNPFNLLEETTLPEVPGSVAFFYTVPVPIKELAYCVQYRHTVPVHVYLFSTLYYSTCTTVTLLQIEVKAIELNLCQLQVQQLSTTTTTTTPNNGVQRGRIIGRLR